MINEKDQCEVLRKVEKKPDTSQRKLATELGFSLGKLNYCLRELHKKWLININNFKKKKDKINYLKYIITPKGISIRTKLTISFMKRTMQEYDQLKEELGNLNKDQDVDHS